MKRYLYGGIPVLALLLVWEAAPRWGIAEKALFPPFSAVAAACWDMFVNEGFATDVAISLSRLLAGLCIGSLIGTATGLLTGRLSWFNRIFSPIIQLLRPLPPVAIIPLVIVWFGIGNFAKIFSIAFAVFFPVWINTHAGSRRIAKAYLWNSRLLTSSKTKRVFQVVLPAAAPFVAVGLRAGISLAFIMVFVSELAGSSAGLGYRISVAHLAYRIDQMMAALGVLALLGALTDWMFLKAARYVFPWMEKIQNYE